MRHLALLAAAATLAGCVTGSGTTPGGAADPELACRTAYSERLGLPMSAIEIAARTRAPGGGTLLAMQTVDGLDSAACRLDASGAVLGIDRRV